MEYTQNYQLPLWDKEDAVLRTDFNENNRKIDAALGNLTTAVPRVAVGTYTGNGSATDATVVDVGFAPKCVIVWANWNGETSVYNTQFCGMVVQGQTLQNILSLSDIGFQVISTKDNNGYQLYPYLNSTKTYFYLAIGVNCQTKCNT